MSTLVGPRKITTGYVIQTFDPNTGKGIEQEFVAGDQVDWEDEKGNPIEVPEHEYVPYHMVQPDEQRCDAADIEAVLDDIGVRD